MPGAGMSARDGCQPQRGSVPVVHGQVSLLDPVDGGVEQEDQEPGGGGGRGPGLGHGHARIPSRPGGAAGPALHGNNGHTRYTPDRDSDRALHGNSASTAPTADTPAAATGGTGRDRDCPRPGPLSPCSPVPPLSRTCP